MARHLPLDHFCPWREEAEELRERLTALEAKTAALERHVFGRRSERLPTVQRQLRREQAGEDAEARRQQALWTSAASVRRAGPRLHLARYTTASPRPSAFVRVHDQVEEAAAAERAAAA